MILAASAMDAPGSIVLGSDVIASRTLSAISSPLLCVSGLGAPAVAGRNENGRVEISFRPLARGDLAQVHEWLQRDHVARWWVEPMPLERVVE